jgi:hypothetical protein
MNGALGGDELAGLLTAAVIRLAGYPPPAARYIQARDQAAAEVDRLTAVARAVADSGGEQRAAADVAGMVGGLSREDLADLLTAAVIRLAGYPQPAAPSGEKASR